MLTLLRFLGHQDWIRFGVRDRIIRFFPGASKPGSQEFEIDFFKMRYKGNLNNLIDWTVCFYGAYEKQQLLLLREIVRNIDEPVFIDVGANIGQHSLFMSRFCSQVHSFEPYEPVRKLLEEKITINNIDNVTIHGFGLGSENDELTFYAPKSDNTGTGSFLSSHTPDNNVPIGKLTVINGDEYIAELNPPKIDLIKIDVEGFEKDVLIGLEQSLRRYRPVILMEFNESTRERFENQDEFISLLPENYKVSDVICNRHWGIFFNRPGCQLPEFDFTRHRKEGENILLQPA